jgi:hypothetical protein
VVRIGHDLPILAIVQWSEPIAELMAAAAKQLKKQSCQVLRRF